MAYQVLKEMLPGALTRLTRKHKKKKWRYYTRRAEHFSSKETHTTTERHVVCGSATFTRGLGAPNFGMDG